MADNVNEPLLQAADQLKAAVKDLFDVYDLTLGLPDHPQALRMRGRLQAPSEKAFPEINERFRQIGYTPVLRRDPENGLDVLLAMPGVMPQKSDSRVWINVLLYGLTILATLFVGATWSDQVPADADLLWLISHLWIGWPFALSLMAILTAHELGHYFAARRYKVPVSLPYFIPMPIPPLGTMGAVIVMKGRTINRRQMLTVGAAGPLSGFIFAVPILLLGLALSTVEPMSAPAPGSLVFLEGHSLLYLLLKFITFGQILPGSGAALSFSGAASEVMAALFGTFPIETGYDVFIHPVAMAGWAGLLVTAFNLIPVGQLDGGHVLYSLIGQRARAFTWPVIGFLVAMGLLFWQGWLLWAALIFFLGRSHPDPLDDVTRLATSQKIIAVLVLIIFVLTFTPLPIRIVTGEGLPLDLGGSAALLLLPGLLLVARSWRERHWGSGALRGEHRKPSTPPAG
jgi:membrane-associated protease RseP (regulator of RpoE activity)